MRFSPRSFRSPRCWRRSARCSPAGYRENPVEIYQQAEGSPLDRIGVILTHGFNLGIDFKGGTLLELKAPAAIDIETLRETLNALDMGDIQVQGFTDPTNVAVRFNVENEAGLERVRGAVQALVPGVEFTRQEAVSAQVSGELFSSSLIALGLAMLLVMVYICGAVLICSSGSARCCRCFTTRS
ncbi:MAG: hypothetical protein WDM79_17380 [Terricaulis sp.]